MSNILARTYDAAIPVTKSDTAADPQGPFAGILVAIAGTLKFTDLHGNDVTFSASLAAGTEIHVACSRVWNTGTGATVFGLRANPYKPAVNS
jgi:hypothetical protein